MTHKAVLLAPHDDDQALFAAAVCIREKPLVVVCTDSYIQPKRGERGCSAEDRAAETERACTILGVPVMRLGIHDDEATEQAIVNGLAQFYGKVDQVYAPAKQGGNPHHDATSDAAQLLFTSRVIEYPTYTKEALYTTGNHAMEMTEEEHELKKRALDCYESQIRINLPHFRAVVGKDEWLIRRGKKCLHLGCGANLIPGWTNVDRIAGADIVCDILSGIPVPDSSYDYVFSEDFLEHLPPEKRVFIMNEIWRVLEPGGIMEHFVPNAGSFNDFCSPTHLSHWNVGTFDHFDVDNYRYHKDHVFEGFHGAFRKISVDLINWRTEYDGIKRAQSIHAKHRAVK